MKKGNLIRQRIWKVVAGLLAAVALLAYLPVEAATIEKPIGTFASAGALSEAIYKNPNLRGVLIRGRWSQVEPSPGVFDFSSIRQQVDRVKSHGKYYSLAIAGDRWVQAVEQAARSFASAFPNKAIAVEVHEIDQSASAAERIINDLWNDLSLAQRVGAAMWWISGKTTYQPNLIQVLKDYSGDIYGQVIGRSDQVDRFRNKDYRTVFSQAKEIGLRYIEPWDYEFRTGTNSANGAWDALFGDFNAWAGATFGGTSPQPYRYSYGKPERRCLRRLNHTYMVGHNCFFMHGKRRVEPLETSVRI